MRIQLQRLILTSTLGISLLGLSACEDFEFPRPGAKEGTEEATTAGSDGAAPEENITLVEREVEAPEVFRARGKALWDGRPSLGGVWVAHPDAKKPERVVIKVEKSGETIVGALFKKSNTLPGPDLQLSSDAATALGVVAGQPTEITVIALRRETVQVAPADEPEVSTGSTEAVEATELPEAEVIATAEAAIAAAPEAEVVATNPKPAPLPRPSAKSKLKSPFVQVGTFSIEKNAKAAVKNIENFSVPAKSVKTVIDGKSFWRVLAGPAQTAAEQTQILEKMQSLGYKDAILVKG